MSKCWDFGWALFKMNKTLFLSLPRFLLLVLSVIESILGAYKQARLPDDDAFHFISQLLPSPKEHSIGQKCVRSSDIESLSDDLMATSHDAKHDSREKEHPRKNKILV
jgi:hypothetical protein